MNQSIITVFKEPERGRERELYGLKSESSSVPVPVEDQVDNCANAALRSTDTPSFHRPSLHTWEQRVHGEWAHVPGGWRRARALGEEGRARSALTRPLRLRALWFPLISMHDGQVRSTIEILVTFVRIIKRNLLEMH